MGFSKSSSCSGGGSTGITRLYMQGLFGTGMVMFCTTLELTAIWRDHATSWLHMNNSASESDLTFRPKMGYLVFTNVNERHF